MIGSRIALGPPDDAHVEIPVTLSLGDFAVYADRMYLIALSAYVRRLLLTS